MEGTCCLFNIPSRNLPEQAERNEEKSQLTCFFTEVENGCLCNTNIDYYHYANLVCTECRTGASLNRHHNMLFLGLMLVRLHKMVFQTSRSIILFRIH
jgi:hypothetical protein